MKKVAKKNTMKKIASTTRGCMWNCSVPGCFNKIRRFKSLCRHCYAYIIGANLGDSQARRNEIVKTNLRLISVVDERRRRVQRLWADGSAHVVHDALEDVRLLMTAVLNDNVDLLEKWNKQLFVAREHAVQVAVHRQRFGGPRGGGSR